jgi:hypothetical protein
MNADTSQRKIGFLLRQEVRDLALPFGGILVLITFTTALVLLRTEVNLN